MSDISHSSLGESLPEDLARAISEAPDAESIKKIMREHALKIGVVRPDPFDENVLHPVEPGTAPRKFARSIIDPATHKRVLFEGATEQEVLAAENSYLKAVFSTPTEETPTRDARGRFIPYSDSEDDVPRVGAEGADLITDQLIDRSLRERGIDVEQLQTQAWERATSDYLSSPDSSWWLRYATEENTRLVAGALAELHLDGNPSADNLRKAVEFLRDNDRLEESPEIIEQEHAEESIASAQDFNSIREALGRDRNSSGLFGR